MATDYGKLKVTELKELLKERGIPSTGLSRKQQIVEALEAHDAEKGGEDMSVELPGEESAEAIVENGQGGVKTAAEQGDEGTEDGAKSVNAAGEVEAAPMLTDAASMEEPSLPAENAVAEPTVMEKNEPVSKEASVLSTPQRPSPGVESQSSDTRKRKRRSPTPPPSEESVNKKLKAAEGLPVKLPEHDANEALPPSEDETVQEARVVDDAPVPMEDVKDSFAGPEADKTVVPPSVSDDVVQVTDMPVPLHSERSSHISDERPRSGSRTEEPSPREKSRSKPPEAAAEDGDEDTAVSPATHPATRALYIRELVRPLQPQQLRDHLTDLATPPHSTLDPGIVETFHLDTLRTHAFVTFTSTSAASRARSALHARIWPDEPARKPLWVDFVPDEKVQDWIDTELSSGTSRRDAKRWEVIYTSTDDGIAADLQEVAPPTSSAPGPVRQPSFNAPTGPGMPNAPLGPRANRPSQAPPPPNQSTAHSAKGTPAPGSASFDVLDQRFSYTTTKPKLYYLTVSQELVTKRLDELDALTSRTWDGGRATGRAGEVSAVDGQLRRYTFEDGERVVDNGPDIGSFGRGPAPGRGGGAGYGRSRGGFRGRR